MSPPTREFLLVAVRPAPATRSDLRRWFEGFEWIFMSSLENKQILLTRPLLQSAELCEELRKRKAIVHVAPLIRTELIDGSANRSLLSRLAEFDWLLFTSANGVESLRLQLDRFRLALPAAIKIAAIGRSTAEVVRRAGWQVSLIPERSSSEGMIEAFARLDLNGKKVVMFVAEKTREIIPGALASKGAEVTPVALYRTVPDAEGIRELQNVPWARIDAVVFMSGSAAEVFASNRTAEAKASRAKFCAVGPATAQRMRELGLSVDRVADTPLTDAIIRILEKELCAGLA